MKLTQIQKLYLSNFLTGLVFWYGIEKLFMATIGIDGVGVGVASAIALVVGLFCDIPTGILADKWSRKGTLILAAILLGISSLIAGLSTNLALYLVAMAIFGLYDVMVEGSYQALVYDSLHEEGRKRDYSKVIGRAYGLFLVGIAVANVLSGFIADSYSYQLTFFASLIPCVINIFVLWSLHEPQIHRLEQKERVLHELKRTLRQIFQLRLLRVLTIIMTALTLMELFKTDFGQLYILRFTDSAQAVGILWAVYAFMWAIGSLIAHRLRTRLTPLIVLTTLPLIFISVVDHWIGLAVFMVQIIAAAALDNQIETRIQDNAPSSVRASLLSVITAAGTAVSIPMSFLLGWVFRDYGAFRAVQVMGLLSLTMLVYWFAAGRRALHADDALTADDTVVAVHAKD